MSRFASLKIIFIVLFAFTCGVVAAQQNKYANELGQIKDLIKQAKAIIAKDTTNTKQLLNKAFDIAVKIKSDSSKAELYNVYGVMYGQKDYPIKSLANFEKALTIYKKLGLDAQTATTLNNISIAQSDLGKNKQSIVTSFEALKVFQKLKSKKDEAMVLMNIGLSYITEGDYPQAITYALKALEIREQLPSKYDIAYSQYTLGAMYNQVKNYQKALEYDQKALPVFIELKQERISSMLYYNMALVEVNLQNFKGAQEKLEKALIYFLKVNDNTKVRKCYMQLADLARMMNNPADEKKYLDLALTYSKKGEGTFNDIALLKAQARIAILDQKYEEAEKYLLKASDIVRANKLPNDLLDVNRALLNLYQKSGQSQKAERLFGQYENLKDSILNQTNLGQVNELQTKYETEKKENQISLLNKENNIKALNILNNQLELSQNKNLITEQDQVLKINNLELKNKDQLLQNQKLDADKKEQNLKALKKQAEIQQLELTNRNVIIGIILITVLAGIVLSYLLYNRYKFKQQSLLQTEIYKQQEIATKAVFEGEQKERIRIARDLHDSIGQMLSVVKMNVSTLNAESGVADQTLKLVDQTITEVRNISHNLIPEELNFGLFAALEDLCDKINRSDETVVSIQIDEEVRSQQFAKQNELSIYRIVQEVLSNMIKHAKASAITIDIEKSAKNIFISIKDDGQGFDVSKINESKGLGWKNITARVHLMDGKMKVNSARLSGTQIEISIPG